MKTRGKGIYESDDGLRQAFVLRGNACKAKRWRADRERLLGGDKRGWDVTLYEMEVPGDRDTARMRFPSMGQGEFCSCVTCSDHPDAKWTDRGRGRVSLTFNEARALAKKLITDYERQSKRLAAARVAAAYRLS